MKKEIRLSMLLSISIILNILESLIPIFNFPGIRIGLANIITLIVLYTYGSKDAIYISILRVLLVGILRTGLFSIAFYFSLFGSIFSIISMIVFKKTKLSIIGVSIVGAIMHNVGQIIAALFLINTNLIYYMPILLITSIITGTIIGFISKELLNFTQNS